ncbi:hypothetical protein QJU23_01275 [Pasteurella atlantica]|uniref:Uncharacterized protein n=2 Tax=Pasteurellaceae TaxID=712 RepID=A0ACC6HJR6_9PAST|nr:hypothetical protein [Pasteurella atlantica]MDP8051053.1 hypothetical protein [Pasteurella atlantica]MDP8104349.1 hypothetical protein [Pasteurella atlantica]MDP8147709.1 hypothetical protein [Pasteurella atlantica]
MNLRDKLLNNTPKVSKIKIGEDDYFIRELTVGDHNSMIYRQRQRLVQLAEEQGIELNLDDEEVLAKQLASVYDPYTLARSMAIRLCDEKGEALFDPDNIEDLKALSKLDSEVLRDFNKSVSDITTPKALASDENSK